MEDAVPNDHLQQLLYLIVILIMGLGCSIGHLATVSM